MEFHKNNKEPDKYVAEEQKVYKQLIRIDHCTWIDLNKVIGVEINLRKVANQEYYEVVFGYEANEKSSSATNLQCNTSLIGVIPWIEFDTYDEAKQYVKDVGIDLVENENFKFNKSSWKFRRKAVKYGLEAENELLKKKEKFENQDVGV